MIAAMPISGRSTLFFKMRGNAELTEAQKSDFIKWVAAVCNDCRDDDHRKFDALFQNAGQRRANRGAEKRLHQMGRGGLQCPDRNQIAASGSRPAAECRRAAN